MAPNKTLLTLDALDEQTALELPDRELMNCGCGTTSVLNVNLAVGANISLGGAGTTAVCGASAGTGGISLVAGAVLTTGTSSCGS
jgi:hypothetical protein